MPVFQLQAPTPVSAPSNAYLIKGIADAMGNMANPFDKLSKINQSWIQAKDAETSANVREQIQKQFEQGKSLGDAEAALAANGFTARDFANADTRNIYKNYLDDVSTKDTNTRAWDDLAIRKTAEQRAQDTFDKITLPGEYRRQVDWNRENQDREDARAVEEIASRLLLHKAEHGDIGYQSAVQRELAALENNPRRRTLLIGKLGLNPGEWDKDAIEVTPVSPLYAPKVVTDKNGTVSVVPDTAAQYDLDSVTGEDTVVHQLDRGINAGMASGYLWKYDAQGNIEYETLDPVAWGKKLKEADPSWVGKVDPIQIGNEFKNIYDRLQADTRIPAGTLTPGLAYQMIAAKSRIGYWGGGHLSEEGYESIVNELQNSEKNRERVDTLVKLRKQITGDNSRVAINKAYQNEIAKINAKTGISETDKEVDRQKALKKKNEKLQNVNIAMNEVTKIVQQQMLEQALKDKIYTQEQAALKEKAQKTAKEKQRRLEAEQGPTYNYPTDQNWKPNDLVTPTVQKILKYFSGE